jgi:hypothetical protein
VEPIVTTAKDIGFFSHPYSLKLSIKLSEELDQGKRERNFQTFGAYFMSLFLTLRPNSWT